jgi:hypothetical protein
MRVLLSTIFKCKYCNDAFPEVMPRPRRRPESPRRVQVQQRRLGRGRAIAAPAAGKAPTRGSVATMPSASVCHGRAGGRNRPDVRRRCNDALRDAVPTRKGAGLRPPLEGKRNGRKRYASGCWSPPSSDPRPSLMAFSRSSLRLARSAARLTSSEPTNSSMACSAPSPLRGPRRTIRA